jgi:hypothetical protein
MRNIDWIIGGVQYGLMNRLLQQKFDVVNELFENEVNDIILTASNQHFKAEENHL